jgi:hypothetical protein
MRAIAAGQETTTKLLSFGVRMIVENPEIQTLLREDRSKIPTFVEETLRTESPVKCQFRMARTSTSIGDSKVPAGSTVMLLPGASNRTHESSMSPTSSAWTARMFASMWRSGGVTILAPARRRARAEGRISLNRILDRMSDITILEAEHGPPGARRYAYEPSW